MPDDRWQPKQGGQSPRHKITWFSDIGNMFREWGSDFRNMFRR
jgi:hypothetical protein